MIFTILRANDANCLCVFGEKLVEAAVNSRWMSGLKFKDGGKVMDVALNNELKLKKNSLINDI